MRRGAVSRRRWDSKPAIRRAAACRRVDASAPTSRSCSARSTASRSSTSTTAPRRRSRARCSTPSSRPTRCEYANVHRGLHYLSNTATAKFEEARETVRRFLNAGSAEEIIFTRNATAAINLVAQSFGACASARATRSCSRSWSTTPTSCPGTSTASARRGPQVGADLDDGELLLDEFERLLDRAPRWSPSRTCRTCSAPSCRSRR